MTKIIFLCHGNICRSPMAEFVMKDLAAKAGLSWTPSIHWKGATWNENWNIIPPGPDWHVFSGRVAAAGICDDFGYWNSNLLDGLELHMRWIVTLDVLKSNINRSKRGILIRWIVTLDVLKYNDIDIIVKTS